MIHHHTRSGTRVATTTILKVERQGTQKKSDLLAVEEPLEIRLGFGPAHERIQKSLSVTMRTPGHDLELTLGFLFTEGIIQNYPAIHRIHHCEQVEKEEERGNVVKVELKPEIEIDFRKLERHFYTNSSCGVCGKASIESLELSSCPVLPPDSPIFPSSLIHHLPEKLRQVQNVFEHTGGLHAAALFDTKGELLLIREDVGRHNALDKLIGATLYQSDFSVSDTLLLLSGRISFELVQKTLRAGIPIIAAVGAPSSLAVKVAQTFNLTLIGFLREQRFNIYTGSQRIVIK